MTTKTKKQKSELEIIVPNELQPVVNNTKVEASKAEQHAMAFAPSMGEYITLAETIKKLNKSNPSANDAKLAREARLKMVKVRTGAEEIKDARKEGIKAEGDLIQALFNVVKNSCILTEGEFMEVEKHQERIEAKRIEDLVLERSHMLIQYGTDTTYLPLGIMTDDQFNKLFENEGLAFNARKEAVEKAEQARIEAEKLAEQKRIDDERIEAENREAQRLENEKLRKENEEKQKQLAQEREASAKESKRLADIAEAERKENQIAIDKANAEIVKIQSQLKAKQDAEIEDRKTKEAEQKAALLAPDKVKVRKLYEDIKAIQIPEFESNEAKYIGTKSLEAIKILLQDIITDSKKLV